MLLMLQTLLPCVFPCMFYKTQRISLSPQVISHCFFLSKVYQEQKKHSPISVITVYMYFSSYSGTMASRLGLDPEATIQQQNSRELQKLALYWLGTFLLKPFFFFFFLNHLGKPTMQTQQQEENSYRSCKHISQLLIVILVNLKCQSQGRVGQGSGMKSRINETWALLCKFWRESSYSSLCIRIVKFCCIRLSVISSIPSRVPGMLGGINIFLDE